MTLTGVKESLFIFNCLFPSIVQPVEMDLKLKSPPLFQPVSCHVLNRVSTMDDNTHFVLLCADVLFEAPVFFNKDCLNLCE